MSQLRLAVVFSRWMSLSRWDEAGMFSRETALYCRLRDMGLGIDFITYGGPEERQYAASLPGIGLHYNRFSLGGKRYERWAPYLHAGVFLRSCAIKTNQVSSYQIAAPAARRWRKPLWARAGFLPSVQAAWETGEGSRDWEQARLDETSLFDHANLITVTTPELASRLMKGVSPARIHVIPNYVDTDLFASDPSLPRDIDILFVGRLEPQKNLQALFGALSTRTLNVAFVGQGSEQERLRNFMQEYRGVVQWHPRLDHAELAKLYGRAKLLVLPSHWEGQPKVLLEAMACSTPVLGADSPGIRDQVAHGDTGWICEGNPEALGLAMDHLLTNLSQLAGFGRKAREHVIANCSLNAVASTELALLHELVNGARAC